MNTTKSLVAISQSLSKAVTQLGHLSESLLSNKTTNIKTRTTRPKKARKARAARATAPGHNRIAHLLKTVRLPKVSKPKAHRLTKEQEDDIVLLLQRTEIPVNDIAKLFMISRAAVYQVRDRRHVDARKGSKELMAGIQRMKREKAKETVPAAEPVAATA